MAKYSLYNISLKNLSAGMHTFEYDLDRKYFETIDGDEVKKGNVKVTVNVKRTSSTFELNIVLKGVIQVPCTRCLDDMDLEVDSKNRLIVKFGKEYSEESDEIVIIPEDEGEINIAWFLYEFVALAIPIKHVHPAVECNRTVYSKLRKHRAVSSDEYEEEGEAADEDNYPDDDDDTQANDPRWDTLKGLNLDEN
ncbi:MAG: DUF177 domain-containing protein [Proteiniphilum sp.]|nr:DUF177 domain-containing protein [Proteiniphilum sp.]